MYLKLIQMKIQPTLLPILYYNSRYNKEHRELEMHLRTKRTTLTEEEILDEYDDFERMVDRSIYYDIKENATHYTYYDVTKVLITEINSIRPYRVHGKEISTHCVIESKKDTFTVHLSIDELIELTGIQCRNKKSESLLD